MLGWCVLGTSRAVQCVQLCGCTLQPVYAHSSCQLCTTNLRVNTGHALSMQVLSAAQYSSWTAGESLLRHFKIEIEHTESLSKDKQGACP